MNRLVLVVLPLLWSCAQARDPPTTEAETEIDAVVAEAESLYWDGQHAAAKGMWLRVLDSARVRRDSLLEARLLTWLGLAEWQLGDYAAARQLGEEALELKLQHGFLDLLPRSYNALGLLAWYEGRLTDAADLFERTAAAASASGDAEYVTKAMANLALIRADFGEFRQARAGFLAARAGARELGDARTEGNALTNLAMLDIRAGDPRSAIGWIEEARALYGRVGHARGEITALGQLGTAYAALGEPRLAIAAFDSALTIARDRGFRQREAANLHTLAEVYREAGNYRRALRLYGEARSIHQELVIPDETAANLRSEAEIHATLGNLDFAASNAKEALQIHRDIGARFAELSDLIFLAELSQRRGDEREVTRYLGITRKLADVLAVRSARVDVALTEARIADQRGNSRRVLRVLDVAANDLAHTAYGIEWEALALRARALARLDRLAQAATAGQEAVQAVERVRSGFGSSILRTSYTVDKATVYFDLVSVLLALGRVDEAFQAADAARGRGLIERPPVAGIESVAENRDREATARAGEILARIDGLVEGIVRYEQFDDTAAIRELTTKLERARRDYELLAITLAEGSPSADSPRRSGSDMKAIQGALRPGEALIEYLVTPDRLLVFVLTSDDVATHETAVSRDNVAGRVRLARDLISTPGSPEQSNAVLSALHDLLLGELRTGPLRDARRLIVIPHGMLTYLPFGALWDERASRYLIEDHALLYLPSAAMLPVLRVATGGHVLDGATAAAVFAPMPKQLPASRAEAQAVQRIVDDGKLYLGKRASEPRLRAALESNAIVHVAAHGVMNAKSPMFSRIEVAPGRGKAASDDGRLEVHEVLQLSIQSPLVFLSGCETGLGVGGSTAFTRGEDYATLAGAFLIAGAENVIATLWQVTDQGAAEFATRFYSQLVELGPADALARAQRETISDPRYRHPYYWAGYRLAGEGELLGTAQNATAVSVAQ